MKKFLLTRTPFQWLAAWCWFCGMALAWYVGFVSIIEVLIAFGIFCASAFFAYMITLP